MVKIVEVESLINWIESHKVDGRDLVNATHIRNYILKVQRDEHDIIEAPIHEDELFKEVVVEQPSVKTVPVELPRMQEMLSSNDDKLPLFMRTDNWRLIFEDNFSEGSLNSSYWTKGLDPTKENVSTGTMFDNEIAGYDPGMVRVSDGMLQLITSPQPLTTQDGKIYQYRTGMISSKNKVDFTSGAFEARIKMASKSVSDIPYNQPRWMLSGYHTKHPDHGELIIMKNVNGSATWEYSAPEINLSKSKIRNWTGWHTFGAHWENGRINIYYDGANVGSVLVGVLHNPMYMILSQSMIIGSDNVIMPGVIMCVDWIRVWERKA